MATPSLQPRITPILPRSTEASVFPASLLRNRPDRPVRRPPSPTSTRISRRGQLHGKGIYDLDVLSARWRTGHPKTRLLKPRPVEGDVRARGPRDDIEPLRRTPLSYEEAAVTPAPLGTGRLAAAAMVLGRAHDARGLRTRGCHPRLAAGRWSTNLRRTLVAPAALATLIAAWNAATVYRQGPGPARPRLGDRSPPRLAARPWPDCAPPAGQSPSADHLRAGGYGHRPRGAHVGLGLGVLADQGVADGRRGSATLARLYVTPRQSPRME